MIGDEEVTVTLHEYLFYQDVILEILSTCLHEKNFIQFIQYKKYS